MADEDRQVLGERYLMGERLGSGGMATVFLAEDQVLERQVAIKWLRPGPENAGSAARRFRREARITASLNHPNTVQLYDAVVEGPDLFLVMEYVPGTTLAQRMRDRDLPATEVVSILGDIGKALDNAHQRGVVHRDVKPANILLHARTGRAMLADLGIASNVHATHMTTSGSTLGTPAYMAPEVLDGRAATAAADIYSLGAVAFEALSGHPLREGDSPIAIAVQAVTKAPKNLREVQPAAPTAAAEVVARALARDPRQRPASCKALTDTLTAAYRQEARVAGARLPADAPAPVPADAGAPVPADAGAPVPADAVPADAVPAAAREPAADAVAAGTPAGAAARGPVTAADPLEPGPPTRSWQPRRPSGRLAAILGACAAAVLATVLVVVFGPGGSNRPAPRAAATPPRPASPKTTGPAGTPSAASRSPVRTTIPAGGPPQTATGPAVSAVAAVRQFYLRAARHDYADAWALAAPSYRQQLQGYDSFRATFANVLAISFQEAQTISSSGSTATVAVRTVSQQTNQTQYCAGTVTAQRAAPRSWLVSQISIQC